MIEDKGKHICGECEFYGKKDLCPWPKDSPWPRPAHERQCRPYHLLIKTRGERDEARAILADLAEYYLAATLGEIRVLVRKDTVHVPYQINTNPPAILERARAALER